MRKILTILVILFFVLIIIPAPKVEATYRLSLTGAVDFIGEPWVAENFTGYVIVGLGEESQSALDITLSVSGDIAQWVTWTNDSQFTLYPSESIIVRYIIEFPASAPDDYRGQITATGIPPTADTTGGAIAPGNVAVAIGVGINLPARVYFLSVSADGDGASSIVYNGRADEFTGNVSYNLTQSNTWIETHTQNITSLISNQSAQTSVNWNITPELGVVYDVLFILNESVGNGTPIDQKALHFRLPTPADIEGVWHSPTVVYADYDTTIYATVHEAQNGQTECTAHYIIDEGTEQTALMTYDSNSGNYLFQIDNSSYQEGSYIEYWVTSHNDASGITYTDESERRNFRVYSPTTPDLVIDENSIVFTPINPLTQPMNETDVTNIFITVKNTGRTGALNVKVRVFDRDVPIWNGTIPSIGGDGNSDTVHFNWEPTEGTYILRFVVDPDDEIIETNENNNYYTLDEITIYAAPPVVEPPPEDPTTDNLPYIVIPVIILLVLFLLFFLLKKKPKLNVMVHKTKPTRADSEGKPRWIYNCSYGDDVSLGNTEPTTVKASKGDIIQVEVDGLAVREDDGRIVWQRATAVKLQPKLDNPDTADKIHKMAKKDKK